MTLKSQQNRYDCDPNHSNLRLTIDRLSSQARFEKDEISDLDRCGRTVDGLGLLARGADGLSLDILAVEDRIAV